MDAAFRSPSPVNSACQSTDPRISSRSCYARVLTRVSTYEVEPTAEGAFMHLHREGERSLGLRISNEQTIVAVTQISREVSRGTFNPAPARRATR